MLHFSLARPDDEPPAQLVLFIELARLRRELGETRRELDQLEADLDGALDELLDQRDEEPS